MRVTPLIALFVLTAVLALGRAADPGPSIQGQAVRELAFALRDSTEEEKKKARELLAKFGDKEIDFLIATLKHKDTDVVIAAAYLLEEMGPRAKKSIPALIALLKTKSGELRHSAAEALGAFGPEAREAVPALLAIPRTTGGWEEEVARRHGWIAARGLSKIGKDSVAPTIKALKDKSPIARESALLTLKWIGDDAKAAAPEILPLAKDKDAWVRYEAVQALGVLGDGKPAEVTALIGALTDDGHAGMCDAAVIALGKFGPKSKPAVPKLIELWKDPPISGIRDKIVANLKLIDPEAAKKLEDK
jgi:HEAT repeat protein